jgi:hypothetical protein
MGRVSKEAWDQHYKYQATEKAKKARAESNKARRMLEEEGLVKKGDGKDVHHKKALRHGGTTTRGNITVKSRSANRAWK